MVMSKPKQKKKSKKLSHIVGLKELRENTEAYIEAVQKGRSFTVVRRSQPIFRMEPPEFSLDNLVDEIRDSNKHKEMWPDVQKRGNEIW